MSSLDIHVRGVWQWFTVLAKSPSTLIGLLTGVFLCMLVSAFLRGRHFRATSITFSLPFGLGNVSYQTSEQDKNLAWKLYVHLKTRKAALPFDEDNDVIAEVYESLYELFAITRELLCGLPLSDLRNNPSVAELMLRVQNDGLRPHLTRWQAPFRKWWSEAAQSSENKALSPQEVQRQFPSYCELVQDLRRTNTELSKFSEELLRVARPERRTVWRRLARRWRAIETTPEPPSPETVTQESQNEALPPLDKL